MNQAIHEGGCLCGKVRYRTHGAPVSTNSCYCTQCRRQTGSALPAFVSWREDAVEIVQGEVTTFRSSGRAVRQFCPDCGSPLFWRGEGSQDVDVFVGSLDRPEAFPGPTFQLWTRHRLPWVPPLPDAVDHEASRQGGGEA